MRLNNWKIELLIFTMMFLAGAAFYHPVEYDNTSSRYALLSAIVDYGTLSIDAYQASTLDKSEWNGHYYSVKAPGASFLGVPVYWFLRNFTPLKSFDPLIRLNMYIVRVMTTTSLFALLGVVMYRLAQFCGAVPKQAFLMVIAYGFGSIALLHATMFSGHQIAASLGFFSFALLIWFSLSNNQMAGFKNLEYGFLAGMLCGFAVLTDYAAIVVAIFLTVYLFATSFRWQFKTGFLIGCCVCVIILAAYNTVCFGHPFSLSYGNIADGNFKEVTAQGIHGIGFPRLESLAGLLFSPSHGVFFIMPVLLLSIWGVINMIDREKRSREAFLIMGIVIGSFLFISGCYGWKGGMTFGPRYLVPMLPFLAFPIAFLRWPLYLFWLLFIPSCVQVTLPVIGVPHVKEVIVNPIIESIIPCIIGGNTSWIFVESFGLVWPWSVITIISLVALLCFLTFRTIHRDKSPYVYEHVSVLTITFLVCWICAILVMLAVIRTDPPAQIVSGQHNLSGDNGSSLLLAQLRRL